MTCRRKPRRRPRHFRLLDPLRKCETRPAKPCTQVLGNTDRRPRMTQNLSHHTAVVARDLPALRTRADVVRQGRCCALRLELTTPVSVSVLQQMISQKPTRPSTPTPNIRQAPHMPSHLKSLEFCCSSIGGVAIRMRCNREPPVRPADLLRSTKRPGVRMSYNQAGGDTRERRSIHSRRQHRFCGVPLHAEQFVKAERLSVHPRAAAQGQRRLGQNHPATALPPVPAGIGGQNGQEHGHDVSFHDSSVFRTCLAQGSAGSSRRGRS